MSAKLHERIEPFFAGGDGFFSTYFPDPTLSVLVLQIPYLQFGNTSHFLYFDYSIDVIEIHVPFEDAMVQVGGDWKGYDDTSHYIPHYIL